MKERTSIEQWKMKVKDERETRERGEMNSWERLKRGRHCQ
jgi:subtilisin-like proprotein convertase family protein